MSITREKLLEMDEARLRRDVLVPLFREMGFRDVFEYHGQALEQGKDIVMWNSDPAGSRLDYAVVVKAKPISGQAAGKGGAGEVFVQVHQSFGSPYLDPAGIERTVDRCFVVCPHAIKKEGLAALKSCLGDSFQKVTVIAGDQLWEKIDEHLSERTVLAKADELRKRLRNSHLHDAKIIIEADRVQVSLPQAEGLVSARFEFPNDPKGRAAFEALQRHIERGEPVTIDGEYVIEWNVPGQMERLLGAERPVRVEIGPSETPEVLMNIELSSHARTVRVDNVPFKGRAGKDEFQIHSALPSLPIEVTVVANKSERRFNASFRSVLEGRNVKQQLEGIRLQEAFAAGGVVRIELAATGQTVLQHAFESGQFGTENVALLPLAEKLMSIQRATNCLLSIPSSMSRDDLEAIELLSKAIEGKPIERPIQSIGLTLTKPGAEAVMTHFAAGKPLDLTMSSEDEVELWDVRIPVGRVVRQLKGLTLTTDAQKTLAEYVASAADDSISIRFTANAEGAVEIASFLKWLPENEAAAWMSALPQSEKLLLDNH